MQAPAPAAATSARGNDSGKLGSVSEGPSKKEGKSGAATSAAAKKSGAKKFTKQAEVICACLWVPDSCVARRRLLQRPR